MKPFTGITKRSNRQSMRGKCKKGGLKTKKRKNCKRWGNSRRKLLIDNLKLMLSGPKELKKNKRETQESVNYSNNRKELDFWLTLIKPDLSNFKKDNINLLNKQKLKRLNSWESSKTKNRKNKGNRELSSFVVMPSCLIKRTWNCKSCRTLMLRSKVGWTTLKKEDN